MSRGVGQRRGSDPMLLWLWSLCWEPPYAAGASLEKAKRKKDKKKKKKNLLALKLILGFLYRCSFFPAFPYPTHEDLDESG